MKATHTCEPWNKGKLIGQKPPLKPKEIWAIRIHLQSAHHIRDLAMFNLAIDSKLRGCDLVNLRVRDITHGSQILPRAMVAAGAGPPDPLPAAVSLLGPDWEGFAVHGPALEFPGLNRALLVVEYKGAHLLNAETDEKEQIGRQWEHSSNGKCLFLLAVANHDGRDVATQIAEIIG